MTNHDPDIESTPDVEETTDSRTDLAAVAKDLSDFVADDQSTAPSEEKTDSMNRRGYLKAVGAAAATGLGAGAVASPAAAQQTITSNQTGTHDGYFYSFWTDQEGTVSMTLEEGGSYSCEWNNTGNFVLGKGWNPGGRRTIEYNATHNPTDNSYLCLYGWTTNPLVEYYIIENYGTYKPGDQSHGTHQTDGSTYELATSERIQQPSIEGTATFTQYWSIRQNQRTSGTITVGNHFDAWESAGLELGSHDYQILATEAYNYSGSNSASVTIGEGSDNGGEVPESGEQAPYNGTPHAIPGRIQAEEYDEGGPGVAYEDATTENEGEAMRTGESVDVSENAASSGSDYSVGHIEAGEWVEYTVNVEESGEYTLEALVASEDGGGAFHLEVDGQDVSGDVSFGATGGWSEWETVSTSGVSLSAGEQVIRVAMDDDWWDLNYLDFSLGGDGPGDEDCADDEIAVDENCAAPAGGDGLYRDVDGSGDTGSNDVVEFFQHVESESVQNNPTAFDFNDSGSVGFDDVVALFNQI